MTTPPIQTTEVEFPLHQLKTMSEKTLQALASDPSTPANVLAELARSDDSLLRTFVARNSACPSDVLFQLAQDEDSLAFGDALYNHSLSFDQLVSLFGRGTPWADRAMARHPGLPGAWMDLLARAGDSEVRAGIAGRADTFDDLLVMLSDDDGWDVRLEVAGNRRTRPETLELLAWDDNEDVRGAVAGNPNTPSEELVRLVNDDETWVQLTAIENPNVPVGILVELSKSESEEVRTSTAENPSTPIDVLAALVADESELVRKEAREMLERRSDSHATGVPHSD